MIRAVIRDRRGNITRGPLNFSDEQDLLRYETANSEAFSRLGQRIEKIKDSPLTPEQLTSYEVLRKLAGQANGVVKTFVFDADMHARWQNRRPTADDVQKLTDALRVAADQLTVLATKEFQIPA